MKDQKNIKIMCFDGGGINGLFTIRMLQRICDERPNFMDDIHMFSGTSAGAINALILAQYPDDPVRGLQRCAQLWNEPKLFSTTLWEFQLTVWGLRPLISIDSFRSVLSRYIPEDLKLGDLERPKGIPVVLTAFDLDPEGRDGWQPELFTAILDDEDLALDAALRACAAPGLTAIHQGYIDGGVFNPTPALSALTVAFSELVYRTHESLIESLDADSDLAKRLKANLERQQSEETKLHEDYKNGRISWTHYQFKLRELAFRVIEAFLGEFTHKQRLEFWEDQFGDNGGILVLSVGTGTVSNSISLPRDRSTKWGLLHWLVPSPWNNFSSILNLMLSAPADIVDLNIYLLKGAVPIFKDYHRLNPATITYPPFLATGASVVPYLKEFVINQLESDARKRGTLDEIKRTIEWLDETDWCEKANEASGDRD